MITEHGFMTRKLHVFIPLTHYQKNTLSNHHLHTPQITQYGLLILMV
jgi:hypothetical protein